MAVTGNMSYFLKEKIANQALGAQAYTPPTGLFVGLWLSALDYSASGQTPGEVTGAGYSRFSATNDLANWTTALTASGTAYKFNGVDFVFPTAQGLWGPVQYAAILDAPVNGNILYWAELATAKAVASADVLRFPSGAIAVRHT